MKIFRNLRSGKRRSKSQSNFLTSDPAFSENGSVKSWGADSRSYSSSAAELMTQCSLSLDDDDTMTEASSLPPHLEDLNDDSPSNSRLKSRLNGSLAMVVYERPLSPQPLPDSVKVWLHSADALIQSREMKALVGTSRDVASSVAATGRDVVYSVGSMVVHAALIPVTVPLHLAATTTELVVGIAANVLQSVTGQSGEDERKSSESPVDCFIHSLVNAIPFLVNAAGRISYDIGSAAAHVVAPVLVVDEKQRQSPGSNRQSSPARKRSTCSGESSGERENMLDRLRLNFHLTSDPVKKDSVVEVSFSRATPSDTSKYLLRVDDVTVFVSPDPAVADSVQARAAIFVDLGAEFSDNSITRDALKQLTQRGMDVAATNASAHIALSNYQPTSSLRINWKPEGTTARQLRKLSHDGPSECYEKLRSQVLVWSGKYHGPKYYGSDISLFLARGVVRRSPRDFFNLLWDSERTGEYNNFSLGRSDLLVIDDSISSGGKTGSKVIKSDTKVPFTGLTVSLSALMHAETLNEGPEEGFVIVSRSLNSGMAGCHVGMSNGVEKNNKNEILLGVNIMRPVPGHPELTDLSSVSQVSSSMVPQFLAFRIGMMGLEDFFSNVRKE